MIPSSPRVLRGEVNLRPWAPTGPRSPADPGEGGTGTQPLDTAVLVLQSPLAPPSQLWDAPLPFLIPEQRGFRLPRGTSPGGTTPSTAWGPPAPSWPSPVPSRPAGLRLFQVPFLGDPSPVLLVPVTGLVLSWGCRVRGDSPPRLELLQPTSP